MKLDGSGRTTLRNRAFLKRVTPFRGRQELRSGNSQDLQRETYKGTARQPMVEQEGPVGPVLVEEVQEGPDDVVSSDLAQSQPRRSTRQVVRPAKYSR